MVKLTEAELQLLEDLAAGDTAVGTDLERAVSILAKLARAAIDEGYVITDDGISIE